MAFNKQQIDHISYTLGTPGWEIIRQMVAQKLSFLQDLSSIKDDETAKLATEVRKRQTRISAIKELMFDIEQIPRSLARAEEIRRQNNGEK